MSTIWRGRVCSPEETRTLGEGWPAVLPQACSVTGPSPTEQSITIVRGLQDVTVMEPAPAWFECETSIPSVRPPKWLLGKTVLQAGADVGLEQKGTVHRLTLRRTCATMSGPVHFTIGKARSTARLVVSGKHMQPAGGLRVEGYVQTQRRVRVTAVFWALWPGPPHSAALSPSVQTSP